MFIWVHLLCDVRGNPFASSLSELQRGIGAPSDSSCRRVSSPSGLYHTASVGPLNLMMPSAWRRLRCNQTVEWCRRIFFLCNLIPVNNRIWSAIVYCDKCHGWKIILLRDDVSTIKTNRLISNHNNIKRGINHSCVLMVFGSGFIWPIPNKMMNNAEYCG